MTASLCAAGVVALLDVLVGAQYCAKLIRGQIQPRVATWLIFEIGVIMSLAAYFTSNDHSVMKAALNVTDAVVVTVILGAFFSTQRGAKITFTRNEQLCLLISCITLVAWIFTRSAWIGFAGFQLVMIVAYGPTIENMLHWKPGPPPEPVETWSINALAGLLGVILDITGTHDYMAMLYPLRAFLLCMVIVTLVIRWNRKSRAVRSIAS